jgi:hypothetical protein
MCRRCVSTSSSSVISLPFVALDSFRLARWLELLRVVRHRLALNLLGRQFQLSRGFNQLVALLNKVR